MKDVRVDENGDFRCWKCGGKNFTAKRTLRSKAAVGVGALLTKKKLKCQSCGEYNDTGNAKPYTGPKSKRAAKKAGTTEAPSAPAQPVKPTASVAEELQQYADLLERGMITQEEYERQKSRLLAG